MWKKRILCLVLVLCAAMVMTACKQKEVYPTEPAAASQSQQQGTVEQQDPQQISFHKNSSLKYLNLKP